MRITRRGLARMALGLGVVASGAAGYGYFWQRGSRPVLAMLSDGVIPLDVVGPMEILGRLPDARPLYVAEQVGPRSAARGPLQLQATLALDAAPAPWVLVVPGAAGVEPTAAQLDWLRRNAPQAALVLAVGEGRRWLQAAGLSANNRNLVACNGGAAALDAALEAAAGIAGRPYAEALQLAIEYDPHPPFVPAAPVSLEQLPVRRVAILLYEGMTALDAIGPYEVFSRIPSVRISLVGVGRATIQTDTGALQLPLTHSLEQLGSQDLLLIPGGSYGTLQAAKNAALIDWLRARVAARQQIVSVCTGALILANTGALKGLTATTHWASRQALDKSGAQFQFARYIKHERITTAAGVSAGIDVALATLETLFSAAVAATVQAQLPYDPHPPFHSGAFEKASAPVVETARRILGRNAVGSALRMTFLR